MASSGQALLRSQAPQPGGCLPSPCLVLVKRYAFTLPSSRALCVHTSNQANFCPGGCLHSPYLVPPKYYAFLTRWVLAFFRAWNIHLVCASTLCQADFRPRFSGFASVVYACFFWIFGAFHYNFGMHNRDVSLLTQFKCQAFNKMQVCCLPMSLLARRPPLGRLRTPFPVDGLLFCVADTVT